MLVHLQNAIKEGNGFSFFLPLTFAPTNKMQVKYANA